MSSTATLHARRRARSLVQSRPLRVLFVAEAFGGGLFEITRITAEGLAARGHSAAIAYGVRPETPADPRALIDDEVELIPMPWTSRSPLAQLRAVRALRRLCDRWRPDVVHLLSSFAGLHGATVLAGRVPTVYTPQGYAFTMSSETSARRLAYFLLEDFVARRVEVVAGCSLSEGEQARCLPGAPDVKVVENGIPELDAVDGRAAPFHQGRPRVVAAGRPSPQRRPEACARILSAVADIADVGWVGGGPESPGRRALGEAGVPVSGWLPREVTLNEVGRASVYLHWTAWDGLPLSVLEAMSRDVVVVASDIGPNREVLGPRQVLRTEAEAIRLIRAIVTDPATRAALLASQRARRAWYGADRMVQQWLNLYSSLAVGRRVEGPVLLKEVPS